MSDEYDWAKDDAHMLEKLQREMELPNEWLYIERMCDCGFIGLAWVLVDDGLWCWDCPGCAYEHEEPAEVLTPRE